MLTTEFKTEWLKKNELLLHKLASKFRHIPTFEYSELIQIVKLYAWEALCKYDDSRTTTCKISTYVYTHVLGYVQREYALNSRPYRINWKDVYAHPQILNVDHVCASDSELDVSLQSDFSDSYNTAFNLKDKLKELLTPLEYEVILSEFDFDRDYKFIFNDYVDIVKPTLYPIILDKLGCLKKDILSHN